MFFFLVSVFVVYKPRACGFGDLYTSNRKQSILSKFECQTIFKNRKQWKQKF